VLACTVFPGAIVLLGFFIWLVRRPTMAPLLVGLIRVPPAELARRKYLYREGYVLLASIGSLALVLHLYDQRVSAASVASKTVDFYPDISQNLLVAIVFTLLSLVAVSNFGRLSAKFGRARVRLIALIFAVLALMPAGIAISKFSNPRPEV